MTVLIFLSNLDSNVISRNLGHNCQSLHVYKYRCLIPKYKQYIIIVIVADCNMPFVSVCVACKYEVPSNYLHLKINMIYLFESRPCSAVSHGKILIKIHGGTAFFVVVCMVLKRLRDFQISFL